MTLKAVQNRSLLLVTNVLPKFWWPRISHYLEGVIDAHPGYDVQSVHEMCHANIFKLHIVKEFSVCGAFVTVVQEYPLCRELFILFGGGEGIKNWRLIEDQFSEYARELECDIISLYGRKGWLRHFKRYDTQYMVITKKV